ncbi:MAG: class I SAM-dependent methyltransferase [Bacteroidota bacterium]|nr:class I SAM-dependent methyltransferase [Bacteroidota bacterium]
MTEEEKIKKHYLLERKLADQIRNSDPKDRKQIVGNAYRTLYEEIPWHISRNKSDEEYAREAEFYLSFLRPLLRPNADVLELGCGSGKMLQYVSPLVASVTGLDVTVAKSIKSFLPNVHLVESDVASFALDNQQFDLIYSLHLIEHLHPDEVDEHIHCMYSHLKPGGKIFIVTPHGLTGPHDISKYFDDYPTGFHMKEYMYWDLAALLQKGGFKKINTQIILRRIFRLNDILFHIGLVRVGVVTWIEKMILMIPSRKMQKKIGSWLQLTNIYIIASKP